MLVWYRFISDLSLRDEHFKSMCSNHHSIDAVQIACSVSLMAKIAPANRVIVARMIWPDLTVEQSELIRDTVSEALIISNKIAKRIGFPEIITWL